jgi:hypothetical protein
VTVKKQMNKTHSRDKIANNFIKLKETMSIILKKCGEMVQRIGEKRRKK